MYIPPSIVNVICCEPLVNNTNGFDTVVDWQLYWPLSIVSLMGLILMVVWKTAGRSEAVVETLTRLLLLTTSPPLLQTPTTLTVESTALLNSIVQVNIRLVPAYSTWEGSPVMLIVGAGTKLT